MTKDEALRMAIEWLDNQQLGYSGHSVRKACQDALAQPTAEQSSLVQEPMIIKQENGMVLKLGYDELPNGTAFYTKPTSREWQSLSDEEIGRLAVFDGLHHVEIPLLAKFIIAIEKALREKNNG